MPPRTLHPQKGNQPLIAKHAMAHEDLKHGCL